MSAQIIFNAKLLKIDVKPDPKTGQPNMRLIFKSQKFDRGLEEMVDCSQPVKVDPEHQHLLEFYKCYTNKDIYLPVSLVAVDGNVYYRTTGDGRVLQLEEKKAPELKA
ncbi:hypothetical protein NYY91_00055 [Acinetobacter baumannii]|nr:hypothetical protein [Acinetobacter baumannii]MCZ3007858.1 hypothetical protein [Acinetobacter baumannii]MDC4581260.1 hypothetical protein [Acinetobacter baumannii]MDC4588463.1 hypothetical protein [Acinetobacter baumannii]